MRIASLASHIPAMRVPATDIICATGAPAIEARVFSRVFGIDTVAASAPGSDIADAFALVLDRLQRRHTGILPDALIYTHSIPVQYSGDASPIVRLRHEHPFLRKVRNTFEIDQYNCAGLFWSLDLAAKLLAGGLADSVAILAGDDQSALPMTERYIPGCTLLGDAFVGLMVDRGEEGIRVLDLTIASAPGFAFGQYGTPEEMRRFNAAHTTSVLAILQRLNVPLDGREPILPHNINQLVWTQFCRASGVAVERIKLDLLTIAGHCYTADPLLLLDRHLNDQPATSGGQTLTLLSVALGGFAAGCRIALPTLQPGSRGHAHS
jgi:3-oxoacyl-[acyl-carrier-protein] synthase III